MLRENHAVFLGKKYRFPGGGGGKYYGFWQKNRTPRPPPQEISVFDQNIDPCHISDFTLLL
jgi:hypothetical protein